MNKKETIKKVKEFLLEEVLIALRKYFLKDYFSYNLSELERAKILLEVYLEAGQTAFYIILNATPPSERDKILKLILDGVKKNFKKAQDKTQDCDIIK